MQNNQVNIDIDDFLGTPQLDIDIGERLFHYTSINGLQSIIENKEFWVTHSKFMNDTGESEYFWSIFEESLTEIIQERSDISSLSNIIKILFGSMKSFREEEVLDTNYLLSFSKNSNSLSMWNYYGKNDGYCIGIHPRSIWRNWAELDRGIMFSASVIYERITQKKILKDELIKSIHVCLSQPTLQIELLNHFCNQLVVRWATRYLPFFKHESFMMENEYRIAFTVFSDKVNYRSYQGVIAPYIKVGITNPQGNIEIQSITSSPYIKHDQALLGLEKWLKYQKIETKLTIDNQGLMKSNIPIRF